MITSDIFKSKSNWVTSFKKQNAFSLYFILHVEGKCELFFTQGVSTTASLIKS